MNKNRLKQTILKELYRQSQLDKVDVPYVNWEPGDSLDIPLGVTVDGSVDIDSLTDAILRVDPDPPPEPQ